MDISNRILSDITVYMKYAKFIPELNRRESWQELVTRNMDMHIKQYPQLEKEIRENYMYVFKKQVLPSMRSMQFAGKPIEISPNRIYNCAFAPIDDSKAELKIPFEDLKPNQPVLASDLIKHDLFFQFYPELAELRFTKHRSPKASNFIHALKDHGLDDQSMSPKGDVTCT